MVLVVFPVGPALLVVGLQIFMSSLLGQTRCVRVCVCFFNVYERIRTMTTIRCIKNKYEFKLDLAIVFLWIFFF